MPRSKGSSIDRDSHRKRLKASRHQNGEFPITLPLKQLAEQLLKIVPYLSLSHHRTKHLQGQAKLFLVGPLGHFPHRLP